MVKPDSTQITAQKYAESTAYLILDNEDLTSKVASAYRELKTAERVYELMGDDLKIRKGVKPKTAINIINLVVNDAIPEEELSEIRSEARRKIASSVSTVRKIQQTKRENGQENGKHFFTEEEVEELLRLNTLVRAGELAYDDIPGQMRSRFDANTFTTANCKKKIQNVLYTRRIEARNSEQV